MEINKFSITELEFFNFRRKGMLRIVDRIFGILLAFASCGHTIGTILWTEPFSGIFIWSLGSSLAGGLLAALNIVRAGRPDDKTLAVITGIGTACWALVTVGFGVSIRNMFDPRPLSHFVISIILVVFNGITIWRKSPGERWRVGSPAVAGDRHS